LTKCSSKNHRLRWQISGNWEDRASNATEAKEWRELGLKEPYDCIQSGGASWEADWPLSQKHWCCSATLGAQAEWTEEQSDWCCRHGSHHPANCRTEAALASAGLSDASHASSDGELARFRRVLTSPGNGGNGGGWHGLAGTLLALPLAAGAAVAIALLVPFWRRWRERSACEASVPAAFTDVVRGTPRSPTRSMVPLSEDRGEGRSSLLGVHEQGPSGW